VEQAGRPEAAATIWDWHKPSSDAPAAAGRPRLRGLLRGAVVVAFGLLVLTLWSRSVGMVVLTIAGVILFSALVSPTVLYAGIERIFAALGRWTGQAINWVLMVPLFYLFFLPFGLLFRRGRRDRMKRFFDAEAETYWEPHAGPTASSASRVRQF
jgi:hypothetical protein